MEDLYTRNAVSEAAGKHAGAKIRETCYADVGEIAELMLETYKHDAYATTFEREPTYNKCFSIAMAKFYMASVKEAIDIVAVSGGSVIGNCEIVKKDGHFVLGISVSKAVRNRGIGRELVETAARRAAQIGANAVYAEIGMRNRAPQIGFFYACGFRAVEASGDIALMKKLC